MNIQRHYFKRFPIELDHDVDPDPEHLKAVDDNAPDPEVSAPDESTMSPEEYSKAMKLFQSRQEAVEFRKKVSRSSSSFITRSGEASA